MMEANAVVGHHSRIGIPQSLRSCATYKGVAIHLLRGPQTGVLSWVSAAKPSAQLSKPLRHPRLRVVRVDVGACRHSVCAQAIPTSTIMADTRPLWASLVKPRITSFSQQASRDPRKTASVLHMPCSVRNVLLDYSQSDEMGQIARLA